MNGYGLWAVELKDTAELMLTEVYSYMKYSNIPSMNLAKKNGMILKEYYEEKVNTKTVVYAISCLDWERIQKDKETKE